MIIREGDSSDAFDDFRIKKTKQKTMKEKKKMKKGQGQRDESLNST